MTEDAFIATIKDNPLSDGPRLVFADWLEEQGQCNRAEFIRVQIELAKRLPGDVHGQCEYSCGVPECRWYELIKTERRLLGKWPHEFIDASYWGNSFRSIYRRGFIEEVVANWDGLRDGLDKVLKNHPIMTVRMVERNFVWFTRPRFSWRDDKNRLCHVLRADWEAMFNRYPSDRLGYTQSVSYREMHLDRRVRGYTEDMVSRGVEKVSTPEGYLGLKWPKVEFVVPPAIPNWPTGNGRVGDEADLRAMANRIMGLIRVDLTDVPLEPIAGMMFQFERLHQLLMEEIRYAMPGSSAGRETLAYLRNQIVDYVENYRQRRIGQYRTYTPPLVWPPPLRTMYSDSTG